LHAGTSAPAARLTQLPFAHVAQLPHDVLPQQLPPTQLPEEHCAPLVHDVPLVCCFWHVPPPQ
jgi:hypothetical protein